MIEILKLLNEIIKKAADEKPDEQPNTTDMPEFES